MNPRKLDTPTPKARLDLDGTAIPKSRLVNSTKGEGDTTVAIVAGPADVYVAEDGKRIPLTEENQMAFALTPRDARDRLENLEVTVQSLAMFIDNAEAAKYLQEALVLVAKARTAVETENVSPHTAGTPRREEDSSRH